MSSRTLRVFEAPALPRLARDTQPTAPVPVRRPQSEGEGAGTEHSLSAMMRSTPNPWLQLCPGDSPSTMKALLLASLAALTPGLPAADLERPNILLIIADDLGTEMLKPYGIGKDFPRTPTINSLAQRSVVFRNAWSSPVCSPTRACIQTGRFGFRNGVGMTVKDAVTFNGLQASEVILPEMLDRGTDGGYQHALFGKWHLNHLPGNRRWLSARPVR